MHFDKFGVFLSYFDLFQKKIGQNSTDLESYLSLLGFFGLYLTK